MSAWLRPYFPLLMSPLTERRGQGSLWVVWMLLALVILPGPAVAVATGNWRFGLLFGAVPLWMLLALTWTLFLANAVRQNTPANACLVPQLRRRLMRITAISGAVCALTVALPIWLLTGEFLLALAGAYNLVLLMLLGKRYTWIAFVPALVSFGASRFSSANALTSFLWGWVGQHHILIGALWLGAELALSGKALRAVFPLGGDTHWRLNNRTNRAAEINRNGGLPSQGDAQAYWYQTSIAHLMGRYAWPGYGAMLARDTVRQAGSGSRRMRMALYALGPRAHWGTAVAQVVGMLALSAGIVWLMRLRGDDATSFIAPTFTAAFAIMAQMGFVLAFASAIQETPVEQGLARLAPAAPPRAAINGLLARAVLRRFFGLWLLSSCGALASGMALGGHASDAAYALSLSALSLPLAATLLCDYARSDTLAGRPLLTVTMLIMLGALLLFALVRHFLVPLPWPVLGLGSAAATAWLLRWRWRTMSALAPAFPAGRIG